MMLSMVQPNFTDRVASMIVSAARAPIMWTPTITLVGASSGGEAVVIANAETDESVAGTMPLSAAGGADRAVELQGRSVFVVATGDDVEFAQTARKLYEKAPEPKELVGYDDGDVPHGGGGQRVDGRSGDGGGGEDEHARRDRDPG